jgi:hypothetical protein
VDERVVDGEHQAAPLRFVDQALCLLGGRRDRLLDEHVLAGLEGLHRQVEMARHRRRDGHRVDARIAQHRRVVGGDLDGGKTGLHAGQALGAQVAHGDQARPRGIPEVANEVRSPISVSDYSNPDHAVTP